MFGLMLFIYLYLCLSGAVKFSVYIVVVHKKGAGGGNRGLMRCNILYWENCGKARKPVSVSRYEYGICRLRNRIAAYSYMNTTVTMHSHTDKIKREDSYEARVVHMVHFGIYGTYVTHAFVSNCVLCIRIKPTSVYEVT